MLASRDKSSVIVFIYLIASFVGFTALWYSEFVISLATALAGITCIYYYKTIYRSKNVQLYIGFILLIVLGLLDIVFNGVSRIASDKALLLLGLVFVGLASLEVYGKATRKQLIVFFIGLVSVVFIINAISVIGYLSDKEYYDTMLLQSKSIPVPNMHHIHFGVLNAMIIIGILGVVISEFVVGYKRVLLLFMGLGILVSFHILSSRTGLLAFYAGSMTTLVVYSFQNKSYKTIVYGIFALFMLAGLTYNLSSSLQNKVTNSIEDVGSWGKGTEINHKSMGMRLEAYKMSSLVLLENPLGVGSNNLDIALQNMYIQEGTVLDEDNRVGPHNQLLEFGVKYGWIGVLVILFFILQWLRLLPKSSSFFWGIMVVLIVSLQFESLFERQKSIYICMTVVPLFYFFFKKGHTNGNTENI